MHVLTLSSVTGLKVLKAGGTDSGASLNEPEVGKVSLILLILLVKKEAIHAFMWNWGKTCGSLDAIPSVTMGSCKSKTVNDF